MHRRNACLCDRASVYVREPARQLKHPNSGKHQPGLGQTTRTLLLVAAQTKFHIPARMLFACNTWLSCTACVWHPSFQDRTSRTEANRATNTSHARAREYRLRVVEYLHEGDVLVPKRPLCAYNGWMHRWKLWRRTCRGELCNRALPGQARTQVSSVEMDLRTVEEIPAEHMMWTNPQQSRTGLGARPK